MINLHDRVILTEAIPADGLVPGDVRTVVHVYRDGEAYEVEFVTLSTIAVVTLERPQVRPVSEREVPRARQAS